MVVVEDEEVVARVVAHVVEEVAASGRPQHRGAAEGRVQDWSGVEEADQRRYFRNSKAGGL